MDFFDALSDKHRVFIEKQPMFFVASACATGRINLSPKGMDSFRVLGPNLCAYMDMVGSGNETAAHIANDGRLTIMFNSFTRNPLILRLYGHGRVAAFGSEEFEKYKDHFTFHTGSRQLILIAVDSIQESCGYGVPEMDLVKHRDTLIKWGEAKGREAIEQYYQEKNTKSIDGFKP